MKLLLALAAAALALAACADIPYLGNVQDPRLYPGQRPPAAQAGR